MQINKSWILIFLLITLAGCKTEETLYTPNNSDSSSNRQESTNSSPNPSMTSIEIVEAALQAWKNNERDQFDDYLDGLGDPKDDIWSSLTEKCSNLSLDSVQYEELESPPGDMGEDSPNVVYVRVSVNEDDIGGFIMHRWPRKHWEISRGGMNCGQ